MFMLRNFPSIAGGMIAHAKATQDKLTDFNVGAVGRTLMEAPAIEIEELYQRIFAGILEAIPIAIYTGFGFTLLEAASARGSMTVNFAVPLEEPLIIPDGTIFESSSTGYRYTSLGDVSCDIGATSAELILVAATPGSAANAEAGSIDMALGFNLPVGTTLDSAEVVSGRDAESDTERMTRFAAYILSIARGTVDAVKYAAASSAILNDEGLVTEYVSRIGMVENGGHVYVYLYGSDGLPSAELVALAQKRIDGWVEPDGTAISGYRAAGVEVNVLPMTEQLLDVGFRIRLMPGVAQSAGLVTQLESAAANAMRLVQAGGVLFADALEMAALAVPGVQRCIVTNDENLICPQNVVLRLDTLTVTWDA